MMCIGPSDFCDCDACEKSRQVFAAVGLIIKDGLVLAISRRNRPNDLGLIGGKLDENETSREAVAREIQEETSLIVDPYDCHLIYSADVGKLKRELVECYIVLNWQGEPRAMEEGFVVQWVPWETLFKGTFANFNKNVYEIYKVMKDGYLKAIESETDKEVQ